MGRGFSLAHSHEGMAGLLVLLNGSNLNVLSLDFLGYFNVFECLALVGLLAMGTPFLILV